MKLITQTDKKVFHAEVIPFDTKEALILVDEVDNAIELVCLCPDASYYPIDVSNLKNPSIIGIQGGGDSLSEDQAREIVKIREWEPNMYWDYESNSEKFAYETALESLLSLLKSHGFETENQKLVILKSDK